MTSDRAARLVAFCCDAGAMVGVGHVMRCVALAEELAARDVRPVFVCDLDDMPWLRAQLDLRGFEVTRATDVGGGGVGRLAADAVVLDSYRLPPRVSHDLRAAGLPVLAVVDGGPHGHDADLYVDQNLGAELVSMDLPAGARRLAGLDYVMLRDETLAARSAEPSEDPGHAVPEVLAFFGGTDAFGAAPVLVASLAATDRPFAATVVAARDDLATTVAEVSLRPGQRVVTIPPTDRLAAFVTSADLVVAAAGSSVWELLCLGAAAAVVRVADNQRVGYDRTVATGAVVGLGALDDVRTDPSSAVAALTPLLTDTATRAALRHKARHLVDGRGRVRVADALLALLH